MGLTFTDMLLLGSATTEDLDDVTFRIIRHNMLHLGAISRAIQVVVKGVAPLVLPDAIAEPIVSLKAFGGCAQSDTPTPSDPVDIVCNNGTLKARYSNGLPLTYQPLEYVSYKGNTLSLGIDDFDDDTSEIYLEWKTDSTSVSSDYQTVFTVWSANTYNSWRMLTYLKQTDKYYVYGNSRNPSTASNVAIDTWHTISCKSGEFKIDNNTYNPTVTSSLTPSDITLKIGGSSYLNSYYKYVKVKRQGEWIANFVPAKRLSDNKIGLYDVVNDTFKTSTSFTAGPNASIPVEVYAEGTQETIAIKDDQNATVSTAVAEMLLKVGDYADEQNIISGSITRKVGVTILDGTESWAKSGTYTGSFFTSNYNPSAGAKVSGFSDNIITHGFSVPTTTIYSSASVGALLWSSTTLNYKYDDGTATVAQFKQWLADQYAAGTPVIVIYPLATATTESVTAQPMSTAEGDNTAEITQSSMSGLELEVTYQAGVALTVEEVEDAQLSPDVEVTIE